MTEHLPNSKFSRTTPETQGKSDWTEPRGVLGELVRDARKRAEKLLEVNASTASQQEISERPSFKGALRKAHVAIIAEVKRSSPSKGAINATLDAADQAMRYEMGGASAVSVLTEQSRFGGSAEDLRSVVSRVSIPVIKKDFHVAESQLEEAVALNASAALIIVRAIEPARLKALGDKARDLGLEILYEIRDENELDRALAIGAEIIGVNNRNLETLEVDATTVDRILPLIPAECIAVAESGYGSVADIEAAARSGADAVLIGSVVSAATDPVAAVAALASVPRRPRIA